MGGWGVSSPRYAVSARRAAAAGDFLFPPSLISNKDVCNKTFHSFPYFFPVFHIKFPPPLLLFPFYAILLHTRCFGERSSLVLFPFVHPLLLLRFTIYLPLQTMEEEEE